MTPLPTQAQRPTCHLPRCRQQVPPGMVVCGDCANGLALELLGVPSLVVALEEAIRKGLRFSSSRPRPLGRPGEDTLPPPPPRRSFLDRAFGPAEHDPLAARALPFDEHASERRRLLLQTLTMWADAVAAAAGWTRPLDTPVALSTFLVRQISWIRSWEQGPELVERVTGLIRTASRAVDRPPDLKYAGPCGATLVGDDGLAQICAEEVYAVEGRPDAECRGCGAQYPVDERRSWLLSKVEDMLLPASEVAAAVRGLGVEVTAAMVRSWAHRRELVSKGVRRRLLTDGGVSEQPLYRVGDVLQKVADVERRRAERNAKAARRGA